MSKAGESAPECEEEQRLFREHAHAMLNEELVYSRRPASIRERQKASSEFDLKLSIYNRHIQACPVCRSAGRRSLSFPK